MMGLVGPLIMLALPLIDVGLAIGRRYLRSEPITRGDRGHIHHMVLARGHEPRSRRPDLCTESAPSRPRSHWC